MSCWCCSASSNPSGTLWPCLRPNSGFLTLLVCWRSGSEVVHRRGEHFPDGSPSRQPGQGQVVGPVGITECTFRCHSGGHNPAACWARGGCFFSFLRCKPPPPCSAPAAPSSARTARPPERLGSCWDLICPEEAWVKLLRCRSWNSGRLSRPA